MLPTYSPILITLVTKSQDPLCGVLAGEARRQTQPNLKAKTLHPCQNSLDSRKMMDESRQTADLIDKISGCQGVSA